MSTTTTPRDDTVTGLSTIEGIDLDAEVPCGHSQHPMLHNSDPKAIMVIRWEHACGHRGATIPICATGWLRLGLLGVWCVGCGAYPEPRDYYRIIEHLR